MEQVRSPNINVYAELGMCLNYVQRAYNSGWAGSYALEGWNMCQFKHADWNLPANVYVPIWFSGYWDGFNYGHVAIYFNGTVYSSPWAANSAARKVHDTLGSIADVERIYGMKYLGWTEDIGNTRVIKPKENTVPKIENTPNWKARMYRIHEFFIPWSMSDEVFNSTVGQDAWTVTENWNSHPAGAEQLENIRVGKLARKDSWEAQIWDRTAERNAAIQERNAARDEAAKYKEESRLKDIAINDLRAELALQSDDTKNLNSLGQALQWFVKRVGLK